MSRKLKPVSPGEVLAEAFPKPLGLSNYRLTKEIPRASHVVAEQVAPLSSTPSRPVTTAAAAT
jgi:plasmid maintenance system antidote protein VapI